MKNWRFWGVLTVLIIGIVLMSGCISPPRPTTAGPAATPTPQVVYVTVIVTPTSIPTVAHSQDPIIGVWRNSVSSGTNEFDMRIRFNADYSFGASVFESDKGTTSYSGTWIKRGDNSYVMDPQSSAPLTWIYMPKQNSIYCDKYPDVIYNFYPGDVMASSTHVPNPSVQTTRTPSEILQGHLNSEESKTITTQLRDPQTIRYTIKLVGSDSADFDLYVKKGTDVSLKNYDYKSASSKSYEQIDIFNPTVDNYNILIISNSGGGDYVLYIDYEYNTA